MVLADVLAEHEHWTPERLSRLAELDAQARAGNQSAALNAAMEAMHMVGARPIRALSQDKDFAKDHKGIGDVAANERGLHLLRIWFARIAAERYVASPAFLQDGLVVVPDALPSDTADVLRAAIERCAVWSPHKTHGNQVSRDVADNVWADVGRVFRDAGRVHARFVDRTLMQRLRIEPGADDIQRVPHSDTFFSALKWWWFPDDVTDGAFNYAVGSPTLTPALLRWHWRQSVAACKGYAEWRTLSHGEGSLRINADELAELGLSMEPVRVKANTLVIANVFGFHARGEPSATVERSALHGSIRVRCPFDPELRTP